MLRFAQSPTGDMNIGDLRVAIFNYIVSKQLNDGLVIRIDDTDREKNIEGKEKDILELLNLFSIEYAGVVHQSDNMKYHQKLAMQLMTQKKAFSCFCSDEKLNELADTAQKEGKPFEYDGFCATLSDETVLEVNAPFTVRAKRPDENIKYNDSLKGELDFTPSEVDSFIILRHDKTPVYNYACAVDDMIMDVSTIIRADEHVANTPKQIHIRKSLGYDKEINYVHIPAISNEEDTLVKNLIDEGFLPAAIANYLVLLGSKEAPKEIFTLEEAIKWFKIENISQEDLEFDMDKLRAINKQHLLELEDMRLSKLLGFADEDMGKLAKLYLDEVSTLKELKTKFDAIFAPKASLEGFDEEVAKIKECLKSAPFMQDFNDLVKYIVENSDLDEANLSKPLRYVLTGADNGPDISDIYSLIKNYLGEIVK